MESCSSCCTQCSITKASAIFRLENKQSPYALPNLIRAGTLVIPFSREKKERLCDHTHAEDGWHTFSGKTFQSQLPIHESFYTDTEFLVNQRFLTATYHFSNDMDNVFVRIYIIPFDLANVKGELRVRDNSVMGPARKYLRNILPLISKDESLWNGKYSAAALDLFPVEKDRRTLSEIYGDLKSPSPALEPGHEPSDVTPRLLDFDDFLEGFGLRSTLYGYQRRTVAAMIQKEMDKRDIPDPLFVTLHSLDGEPFYLQPGTMEILHERPTVTPSRSGILCEELGTGKTVITLALVLSTLNQLSAPEESITDERPIMTPLSFRHFASPEEQMARKKFYRNKRELIYSVQQSQVPSLTELLLHLSRIRPDTRIPQSDDDEGVVSPLESIRVGDQWKMNIPFYHHYAEEPIQGEWSRRRTPSGKGPRVMYLTSATLVVVPPNLLSQWDREIQKHCNCRLRVLILRSDTKMPLVASLASDYDIILMTYKRFSMEGEHDDIDGLHTWEACKCLPIPGSRIPYCTCRFSHVSPLLQVRWKRLVIDEGHVSASLQTILTPFTKKLSVERRWIVTGTPTTNLLGLSLGTRAVEDTNETPPASEPRTGNSTPMEQDDIPSRSSSSPPVEPSEPQPRIWNKEDRQDLGKLGKMITHFIAVPQFSANPKLMTTHVIEPLLDLQGPRGGAIRVLQQVMESTMLRHRIEDVETEVLLPPLKRDYVLLDLDPYAVKSYNSLQAIIAINAVDSERKDQDYMFHPRNAESLQTVVKNLSQLMFWRTDDELYNVDELAQTAQDHIDRARGRNASQEDLDLLEEALEHVKVAAADPVWRSMQSHEDVPYRISGLQQKVLDAWSRTPQSENSQDEVQLGFLHADRILKMLDIVRSRPLIAPETLVELGVTTAAEDKRLRELYVKSLKGKDRRSSNVSSKHHEEINANMKSEESVKKVNNASTLRQLQKDFDEAVAGEEEKTVVPQTPQRGQTMLSMSLLKNVQLGSSVSSKLNYIINEVLTYSQNEKFLIFSDSALTLAHVSEALELLNVKFLRFTTTTPPRVREQIVLTFETSDKYRVFLMELKHGARGLNLISASRVIFCEPVWQADVESQAIKRAHRIGQTKAITVKTLAIRGTAEENMMARREHLKVEGSHQKLPKVTEETGMRHYIANPKFIDYEPERYSMVDLPLLPPAPTPPGSTQRTTMAESPLKRVAPSVDVIMDDVLLADGSPIPLKKKRMIRFE